MGSRIHLPITCLFLSLENELQERNVRLEKLKQLDDEMDTVVRVAIYPAVSDTARMIAFELPKEQCLTIWLN